MESNVNVQTRALRAAERTGNGSGPLHPVSDDDHSSFWERIKRLFPSPEELIVAGRAVKGIVITPAMGLTIFLALGSVIAGMYWRTTETIGAQSETINKQNELLIRLDQRFIDKDTHDREKLQELRQQFESVQAWQQVTNKEIAKLQIKR